MSDETATAGAEEITVHLAVEVMEVKPVKSRKKLEIKLSTDYNLEKLDGLTEALMNSVGSAAMKLTYTPEQTELEFDGEGQPDLPDAE